MDAESRVDDVGPGGARSGVDGQGAGVCRGQWRLKPNVVVREEEDGVILYEPDTDSLSVINMMGGVLLRCSRGRISFDEWCRTLQAHYGDRVERSRITADVSKFMTQISHFMEPCHGQEN